MVRMWKNWNPSTLLIAIQNGAGPMESNLETSQKIKNGLYYPVNQSGCFQ
jgi:hypothetical protein